MRYERLRRVCLRQCCFSKFFLPSVVVVDRTVNTCLPPAERCLADLTARGSRFAGKIRFPSSSFLLSRRTHKVREGTSPDRSHLIFRFLRADLYSFGRLIYDTVQTTFFSP